MNATNATVRFSSPTSVVNLEAIPGMAKLMPVPEGMAKLMPER